MAFDVSRIRQLLRQFDSHTLSQFSVEFASSQPQYRKRLRHDIEDTLSVVNEPEKGQLLNLDERPDLEEWSISISHCKKLGGWCATPKPGRVGLDIEEKSRIELRLIERVTTSQEIKAAPHFSYLWCAKEAYFKALAGDQPVTISELTIQKWRESEGPIWHFESPSLQGALIEHGDLLIAVARV